jgi:O-antigen/teichoic acid export membrane protein
MLLVTRILICVVMGAAITNILPGHRWRLQVGWSAMRPLFVFGGWMSLSNVLSPVLVYIDRFMLAALAGVAAVGYYTAPFDAVMRLLIIPASLMGAVYPSVSAKLAVKDYAGIDAVYTQAIRKTLILLMVPGLVIGVFGPWLLERWLGPAFASEALVAVRILAVGVFFHAMARIPSGFINALGRPDLVAKLNLVEVIFHIPIAWALISRFGLTGAALAWTLRVTLDAVLLYAVSSGVLRRLDRGAVEVAAPA